MTTKRPGPPLGVSLTLAATAGFAAIVGTIAATDGQQKAVVSSAPIARDVVAGQATVAPVAVVPPATTERVAPATNEQSQRTGERIIVLDPGVRDATTRAS